MFRRLVYVLHTDGFVSFAYTIDYQPFSRWLSKSARVICNERTSRIFLWSQNAQRYNQVLDLGVLAGAFIGKVPPVRHLGASRPLGSRGGGQFFFQKSGQNRTLGIQKSLGTTKSSYQGVTEPKSSDLGPFSQPARISDSTQGPQNDPKNPKKGSFANFWLF